MKTFLSFVVVVLVLFFPVKMSAVTYTWTGLGTPNTWNNAGNWSPAGIPSTVADDAIFPINATITSAPATINIRTIQVNAGVSVNFSVPMPGMAVILNTGTSSVGVGGQIACLQYNSVVVNNGTFALGGSLFFNGNPGGLTLNGTAALTVQAGASIGTIWDGTITLNGTSTLTINGMGNVSPGGAGNAGHINIALGATLNIAAGGTLTTNAMSIGTSFNVNGTLQNAGTCTLNSGILNINSGGIFNISTVGLLNNAGGTVNVNAGGILDLNSSASYTGTSPVYAATGTLRYSGTGTNAGAELPTTMNGQVVINCAPGTGLNIAPCVQVFQGAVNVLAGYLNTRTNTGGGNVTAFVAPCTVSNGASILAGVGAVNGGAMVTVNGGGSIVVLPQTTSSWLGNPIYAGGVAPRGQLIYINTSPSLGCNTGQELPAVMNGDVSIRHQFNGDLTLSASTVINGSFNMQGAAVSQTFNLGANHILTLAGTVANGCTNTIGNGGSSVLNIPGAPVTSQLIIQGNAATINASASITAAGIVGIANTGASSSSIIGGGTVNYLAGSALVYSGPNNNSPSVLEFPASGPTNLTINKTAGSVVTLPIGSSLPNTGVLTLTQGILDAGSGVLTLNNDQMGAITGGPFNTGTMIRGALYRAMNTGIPAAYLYPIGAGASYLPVIANVPPGASGSITATAFASNSMGTGDGTTLQNALSTTEFWQISGSAIPTVTLDFARAAVFPVTSRIGATNSPMPQNSTYSQIGNPLGVAGPTLSTTPHTISGFRYYAAGTIPPTTYTWNNGGGAWGTPGNWTPARTTPLPNDILQFLSPTTPAGATISVSGVPTQTIGKLIINNGGTIDLAGAGATLTVQGVGAAPHVDIQSMTTLSVPVAVGITAIDLSGGTTELRIANTGRFDSFAPITGTGFVTVLAGATLAPRAVGSGVNGGLIQTTGAGSTYSPLANYDFPGFAGTTDFASFGSLPAITQMNNLTLGVIGRSINSSITVNGTFSVFSNSSVNNGVTLTLAGAGNGVAAGQTLTVNGTLRIQNASTLSGGGAVTYGGTGDLQYIGNIAAFPTVGIELPGAMNRPVTINNTQGINGGITLSQPTDFTNPSALLSLTSGLLKSNGAAMPIFSGLQSPVGASAVSFIDGPMRMQTSAAGPFPFPVGKLGQYLPLTLSSVTGAATVEVEAFAVNSGGSAGTGIGALGNEYWSIVGIAGSYASAVVNLNRPSAIPMGSSVGFNTTAAPTGTYQGQGGVIATGITSNLLINPVTGANQYFAIGAAPPTTFYYKSGNPDPSLLTSWDGNINGGGGTPSNFGSGTFYITNGRTATFTSNSGIGGTFQVESGGALAVANGVTLTSIGLVRINGGGRLTLQGTGIATAPSGIQYLAPTAILDYNAPVNRLTTITEFPDVMPAQVAIQNGSVQMNASKHLQSGFFLNNSTLTFGLAHRLRLSGAAIFQGAGAAFVSDSTDTLMVDGTGSITGSIGIPALARLTMNRGGQTLALSGSTQITQQLGLFGGNVSVPNGASVVLQSSADTALVGGNSLSFVSGSLVRQLRPNLTPTTMLPIFYPIGRGITYLPLTLTEATTGTVAPQVSAEAFAVGAGGTPALGVPGALSTSEYWRLSAVNGSFTGARVGVRRGGITSMNTLASSLTQTGLYTSVGGSFSNLPQGLSLLSDGVSNSSTRFYSIVGTLQGSPRITGFTPSIGGEGTTMLIRGINFTTVNAVAVGGVPVQSFMRLSDTTISVVLGAVATGPIQVGSPLGGAASDSSFTFVPLPVIGNILPNPAGAGTVITISGANLSGLNTLQIGGVTIPQNGITANPDGSFTVQIPLTATTSTIVLSTPGGTVISTTALTLVSSPVLTSFSPAVSSTGAVLTILGQNFTPGTTVRFGNVFAQAVTVNTNGRLSVVVPPQALPLLASSGDKFGTLTSTVPNAVYLTVRTGGGTVTSATQFVYSPFPNGGSGGGVDPLRLVVLSEARSKIVPVGGRVRVTGANLELIQELTLRTSISSTKASYILSSSAEMTVLVPSTGLLRSTIASLSSSLVTVDALGAFNRTVVADMFTLVAVPIATSVAPSDAAAGEEILVRGENLDLISSASIGGTAAMFRLVNGQLFVRVPSVNVSGVQLPASGILQFTSLGGIVTTAAVVNAALASGQPVIISFSPTTGIGGTVVVVSGVNFTRVTDALVGGVPVGSFVINSSTQMTITLGAQVTSSSQGGITLLSPLGSTVSLQPFIFTSSLAGDIEALERALSLSGLTLRDIAIEQTDNRVTSILAQNRPLNLTLEPFIAAIAPLSELRNLDLSNTGLMGAIPLNLARFTKLERLNLSKNSLTGTLPSELLCSYKNLQILDVSANKLEGLIPVCIATLDKVRTLNLSQNRFTGGLPKELGGMASLEELLVNNNRLTGSLPPEFGTPNGGTVKRTVRVQSAQTLRVLDVSANELTGGIPSEWGGMSALQQLNVSNNRLSGVLPSSIANWDSLQVLNLGYNRFSGTIPAMKTTISSLNVEHNNFSGRLPETLSRLRVLKAARNSLTGLPELLRIDTLRVDSNSIEFGSLEANRSVRVFVYTPQDSIGTGGDTVVRVSSRLVIPSGIGGKKTVYQWLRNGRVLAGADAEILVLESAKAFQSGVYVCRATNSLLPELTLFSRSYKLVVTGADQTLDAPELLFPSVQAENIAVRPRLKWSGVEGAEQYELTVGRDAALRDVVLRRTVDALAGSSEQSYRLLANDGALERGGQYFWRVRALAVGSEGIPSETRSFRVVPLGIDIGLSTVDAGRTLIGTQRTGDGVLVNVGLSAITLDSATAITNTDVFSLANQTRNVVMQANEEVPINVSFTPKVAGEALASVQVWYKDAQQTQRQVRFDNALRGRGGALRVDGVVFPAVRLRRTALQWLRMINVSRDTVVLTGLRLLPTNSSEVSREDVTRFALDALGAITVLPNDTVNVTVRCTSPKEADVRAQIQVLWNTKGSADSASVSVQAQVRAVNPNNPSVTIGVKPRQDSVPPGSLVLLDVYIQEGNPDLLFKAADPNIRVQVSFDPQVLALVSGGRQLRTSSSTMAVVEVQTRWEKNRSIVLATIECRAVAGERVNTRAMVIGAQWGKPAAEILPFEQAVIVEEPEKPDTAVKFTTLVSRAGGTRLIGTAKRGTIAVIPNPASGDVKIGYTLAEAGDVEITLLTASGEVVQTLAKEWREAGEYSISADLRNVPSGAYRLVVRTRGRSIGEHLNIIR